MRTAITIGAVTHAAGANLLSGSFDVATIFGPSGGTAGSFGSAVSSGATITYTSDFLNFANTNGRDMSFSLTSIVLLVSNLNKRLNNANGRALRGFRATSAGSFSADPAPTVVGVPEPQV